MMSSSMIESRRTVTSRDVLQSLGQKLLLYAFAEVNESSCGVGVNSSRWKVSEKRADNGGKVIPWFWSFECRY